MERETQRNKERENEEVGCMKGRIDEEHFSGWINPVEFMWEWTYDFTSRRLKA